MGKARSSYGADRKNSFTASVVRLLTVRAGTLQIDTSTHLAQVGNNYFLDNVNNSGPLLKYKGAPATVGEFGTFTPIGAADRKRL